MRIETLYLALQVDEDGEETIITSQLEVVGMVPLVASTEEAVPFIEKLAAIETKNYTIAKFTRID